MERQQVLFVDFTKQDLPEDHSVFHPKLTPYDVYRDVGRKQTEAYWLVNFGFTFPWMKKKGFMVAVRYTQIPGTPNEEKFVRDLAVKYAEVTNTKLTGVTHTGDFTIMEFAPSERALMLICDQPFEMLNI